MLKVIKRSLLAFALIASSPATANYYSTHFPLTENPISEGGKWTPGTLDGFNSSVYTNGTNDAFGNQISNTIADPIAILTGAGSWANDQAVSITVGNLSGATNEPEIECHVRMNITSTTISGYEITHSVPPANGQGGYILLAKWGPTPGTFTIINQTFGTQYNAAQGDVISCSAIGNVMTSYHNGVVDGQFTDTDWPSGYPGFAFDGGLDGTYSITSFSATDQPAALEELRNRGK